MNVSDWLTSIKSLNVKQIDLSLERVIEVAGRLALLKPDQPVITIAGTNGKGSTVAGLQAVYLAEGYRVGAFTSPFLFRYNEQFQLNGQMVSDDVLCDAFLVVKEASFDIPLTPFEFGTLAAFVIFKQAELDLWILEVGLGGRFDAVNAISADLAIVTSIGIDHTEWLGDTRELIAYEKAGIFRANHPAISGDWDTPTTLIDYANALNSPLFCQGHDFGYERQADHWTWFSKQQRLESLPYPSLALQNMSTVLMAVESLQTKRPVSEASIVSALKTVTLPGRIQEIPGVKKRIHDVSHNPAAVAWLAEYLQTHPVAGKTSAVFSMLADKDIETTLQVIKEHVTDWYVAPLKCDRAASKNRLLESFQKAAIKNVQWFESIALATQTAEHDMTLDDRLVVFGSFHTVAESVV